MESKSLDQRETRAWRGYQRIRAELSAHLARELASDSGMSEAEYAVLVAVSEAPDRRIRWRELCHILGWDPSRLSHQVRRMEARGSVVREPCDHDGRGSDVVLTNAGLAAIAEAAPLHLATVRHCFADVLTSEQLDVLGDIADAIIGHLATEHSVPNDDAEGAHHATR